jgi:phosphoserine phosphatase
MSGRGTAFFDLDGTLMPLPSLEWRFFRVLRHRREIPLTNYFWWLCEALKLPPREIATVTHTNKMYLKGLQVSTECSAENSIDHFAHKSGHQDEGQASAPPRRNPRWPVPHFFEEGVERVAWHAMQGHAIVIVSGTLEPLAGAAARALETELAERGIAAGIRVCATNLEESEGRWTGRTLGQAMFGKAKARAVLALAKEMGLHLSQSWAYGDSAQDRWMLAAVGHPVAVNPARSLARIVRTHHWPAFHWQGERNLTPRRREHRDKKEDLREERTIESLPQSPEARKQLRHAERCT